VRFTQLHFTQMLMLLLLLSTDIPLINCQLQQSNNRHARTNLQFPVLASKTNQSRLEKET